MQWNAYPGSSQWAVGTLVQIIRFLMGGESPTTPTANDSLVIEFPDNTRAGGNVIGNSANQITVSIAGANWNLEAVGAPSTATNGQLTLNYVVKASA